MDGDILGLLADCALGLIALGAVVGVTVTRQVRRFADQVREDERRAEAERAAEAQRSDRSEQDENNSSGESV